MSSKDKPIRLSHIRYDQISLYQPQSDTLRLTPWLGLARIQQNAFAFIHEVWKWRPFCELLSGFVKGKKRKKVSRLYVVYVHTLNQSCLLTLKLWTVRVFWTPPWPNSQQCPLVFTHVLWLPRLEVMKNMWSLNSSPRRSQVQSNMTARRMCEALYCYVKIPVFFFLVLLLMKISNICLCVPPFI